MTRRGTCTALCICGTLGKGMLCTYPSLEFYHSRPTSTTPRKSMLHSLQPRRLGFIRTTVTIRSCPPSLASARSLCWLMMRTTPPSSTTAGTSLGMTMMLAHHPSTPLIQTWPILHVSTRISVVNDMLLLWLVTLTWTLLIWHGNRLPHCTPCAWPNHSWKCLEYQQYSYRNEFRAWFSCWYNCTPGWYPSSETLVRIGLNWI